jgi:hypothetical protein
VESIQKEKKTVLHARPIDGDIAIRIKCINEKTMVGRQFESTDEFQSKVDAYPFHNLKLNSYENR